MARPTQMNLRRVSTNEPRDSAFSTQADVAFVDL